MRKWNRLNRVNAAVYSSKSGDIRYQVRELRNAENYMVFKGAILLGIFRSFEEIDQIIKNN